MTVDIDTAIQQVHRANIGHYRSLLLTHLTHLERQFIERRIAEEEEEEEALRNAANTDPPFDLAMG